MRELTTFTAGTKAKSSEVNGNTTFLDPEQVGIYYVHNYDNDIQTAIDAAATGGNVVLGVGTYNITTPLTITTDGIKIIGSGNGSLIKDNGLINTECMISLDADYVTLRDFRLAGNDTDKVDGIRTTTGEDCGALRMNNVRIHNVNGQAIRLEPSTNQFSVNIQACLLANNDMQYNTTYFNQLQDSQIIGNTIICTGAAGAQNSIALGASTGANAVIGNTLDDGVSDLGANTVANNPAT